MDKNKSENFSSLEDSGPPEKRRRVSDIFTTQWKSPSLKTEYPSISHSSIETTETNNRLDRFRSKMNNLWEQELRILEAREEASKKTIRELEFRLADAHEEKMELHQKITQLLNENTKLGEVITQQTTEGTAKLKEAANMIIKLRQKLITCSTPPPPGGKCPATELEKAKMEIEKLESEKMTLWVENQDLIPRAARAKELEAELKLADKIISNLREIVTEKVGDHHGEDVIDIKHEMLGSRGHEENAGDIEALEQANESSSGDDTADIPEEVPGHDDQVPEDLAVEAQPPENERPIWVGTHFVLASHPKFFEIDWTQHYQQKNGRNGFRCKICSHRTTGRVLIEDHVWLKHYGGRYKCPVCPDYPISWRYDIKRHIRTVHSSDF